ncbi:MULTISPECIES: response regulator [Paracoccus]|jgi:two-component system nitrogen regulation response regulator GlnG|uniref:DNA-binding transcriptional regulator NtrC n=1 Tax=Paracoccus denitrificans (strain Pd 1222) TaxID=318586 RepID=A1B9J9_PARDP|nr:MULTISPECIES: sigma-54 dependent transcriptional regulator [Paracoccus]ABL72193.1 two component, sigma54 specific, transcriptional regulator, Fis family [Paracoccus denitrificans PD1222]MBB4625888.1 two-component system nitrogen regulation response regulator GlnG [Paracoccus denitrificans]MCU7426948.1 sigma-54 dependent transcriptional regulator [Paracoccus denitrificans]QAR28766.1 sigma-54-dependent Fis family transcriptional regulator [Paracoccus denitrificans]UFS66607.1 sigma-54 dependen
MDGTVLIADDDRTIRTVLTQALTRAGCRVHATGSLSQLLRWVEEGRGDLVVTDVMMPDGNGIDMIPAIRKARPDLPVIVISAQNTIVTAIRATEAAAFDYLPKPFDLPDLMARAGQALSRRVRRSDPAPAAAAPAPEAGADPALPLIGHAPSMQNLFRMVARVLNADLPVIVAGEAGVGKTVVARSFHDLSDRREAGLVVLTAADLSEEAIHNAAERAQGGTLLIEDPAGFDAAAQARLIGMIEAWEVGPGRNLMPRLVSTTGPDPQADVAAGRLRADLYYRLAGVTITVPPLRARVDDIPPLARHLLARAAAQGLPQRKLSEGATALIRAYPFPGNVRELENLMRRLALTAAAAEISEAEARTALAQSSPIMPQAPAAVPTSAAGTISPAAPVTPLGEPANMRLAQSVEMHLQRYFDLHGDDLPPPGLYDRILREIEKPLLEIALDATGGNQLRCADLLGINRNTLRKKLTDLNIEVTRRRKLM